ncbi:MAG: RtcB family protein [Candidatus Tagabacteria bacterium]
MIIMEKKDFIKLNDELWEIPKNFRPDMKAPARIYADENLLKETFKDRSIEQLINTATLPGIQKYALAMPDIHEGYGFPIGGVCALSIKDGVISPGGVGYDINCGVRLLRSDLTFQELESHLENLANQIQADVPSGLGRGGAMKLHDRELDQILNKGAARLLESGYAEKEDLENCEAGGFLKEARAEEVSSKAKSRGRDQLGTIGSGNHFLEIEKVEKILEPEIAKIFGLFQDQIVISIHTGSRGLGHQVATDYIQLMTRSMPKYNIKLPDRELVCVPFLSPEGQKYFSAMSAAANFAWANRQLITYLARKVWEKVLGNGRGKLSLVYDVCHNIAKVEEYDNIKVCVHRKGATRAFGPNNPEIPEKYRKVGQPVLIPGSMGTASYVLAGTDYAMKEVFGSTCHGAGRTMSRHASLRLYSGQELKQDLEKQGIIIRAGSIRDLAEEAPFAYKDVDNVVNVVHNAGIAKKVARLVPLAVIKG